jgi:hypothetical protein
LKVETEALPDRDALRLKTTRSDSDGTFVFSGIAPGHRTMFVREPREGGATSLEISPEPDRLLDLGDVVVPLSTSTATRSATA